MDKIILPRIAASGRHGCNAEEKLIAQPFMVAVSMDIDTAPAAAADDLALTVDYGALYLKIKALVERESYNLLETLAAAIARLVLAETAARSARVRVEKCAARLGKESFPAAIEIERQRI